MQNTKPSLWTVSQLNWLWVWGASLPILPFLMDKLSPSGQNKQINLFRPEQVNQSFPFPCRNKNKNKCCFLKYGWGTRSLKQFFMWKHSLIVVLNCPHQFLSHLYKLAPCLIPSLCRLWSPPSHLSAPPPPPSCPLFGCSSILMFLSSQMETIRLPLPHWMIRGNLVQFQIHKEQKETLQALNAFHCRTTDFKYNLHVIC